MEESQVPPPLPVLGPARNSPAWRHGLIACLAGAAYTGFAFRAIAYEEDYGLALFVVAPLVLGFVSGFAGASRGFAYAIGLSFLSLTVATVTLLAFEVEGLVCIIMAAPIELMTMLLGTVLGVGAWELVTGNTARVTILVVTCSLAPAMLAAESALQRTPPVYELTSTIEIDAPPETVWPYVAAFPPIPEPTDLAFRAGIAYPIEAQLHGEGVGAIRHCNFNTGTFVEPIEIWEAPHRLAFGVTEMPEPMIETGLYGEMHTPHLKGFLVAKRGQFLLTELPGGKTRVDGTTWYSHGLWPAWYWRLWSDELIHSIHNRVLRHIKTLAEAK